MNGVSSTKANLMATLDFRAGTIKDVKFVEDGTLMLLWFSEGKMETYFHLEMIT